MIKHIFKIVVLGLFIKCIASNVAWGNATFYEGLPNEGYLDSFHHIEKIPSDEKIFYALRFQKTTDLLRSRKALQDLYKSFPGLKKQLNFYLPKEVRNTFLNQKGIAIHNISLLSEQLNDHTETVDQKKLEKVLGILMQATLKISEIDQMIKTISSKSLVKHKDLRPLAKSLAQDIDNAKVKALNPFILRRMKFKQIHDFAKEKIHSDLMKEQKVRTHLSELEGMKAFLLNRYPILDIKSSEEDIPFYKILNSNMISQGFPDPEKILNYKSIILDTLQVEWRDDYEQAMEVFLKNNQGEDGNLAHKLFPEISGNFQAVLEKQLEHNTYWLRELNAEVEAKENLNPLLFLTQNSQTWDLAKESFIFIERSDWNSARIIFDMEIRRRDNLKQFRQEIMQGAGYALGGIGMVSMFIPGAQVFTGPLIFGSAALLTIDAGVTYVDSRKYSEMSQNLFYSSRDGEDVFNKNEWTEMEKDDYTNLIFAAAMSATSIRIPLVTGLQKVGLVSKEVVQISKDKLRKLTQNLGVSSKLLVKGLGIKYTASVFNLESKMNQIAYNAKLRSKALAKTLGTTYKELRSKFIASSIYERYFIKENLKNVLSTATMNSMLEIGIALTAEYMTRGDSFEEDLPYVIMNVVTAVGLTFMMDAINVKPLVQRVKGLDKSSNRSLYDSGLTTQERLTIWKRDGSYIAAFSFPIMGVVSGSVESRQYAIAQENGENPEASEFALRAALNTVYMSLFLGVVAPVKNQAVYAMENKFLRKKIKSSLAQNAVIIPTRLLNLFAGSFAYTASAQALGLQGGDNDLAKKLSGYINAEYNFNNSGYLYPELLD